LKNLVNNIVPLGEGGSRGIEFVKIPRLRHPLLKKGDILDKESKHIKTQK
jgi:hypothetical protein